jgi:hypothetical protein
MTANFVLGKTSIHAVADARLYGGIVSAQATAALSSVRSRKPGGAAGRPRTPAWQMPENSPPSQETGEVRSLRDSLLVRPAFNSHA